MPRPRAADHALKRQAILEHAAERFARTGYAGTSMAEIARACGTSKALLYHYYRNKEDLLGDLLQSQFEKLEAAVAAADDGRLAPADRLRGLVHGLLQAYAGADALHRVQINDLDRLPPARQAALRLRERRLVARFRDVIAAINPKLARKRGLLMPVTMSLFGMLNWSYLWFREGGSLSRRAYADLVAQMTIDGIANLAREPEAARRYVGVRPSA